MAKKQDIDNLTNTLKKNNKILKSVMKASKKILDDNETLLKKQKTIENICYRGIHYSISATEIFQEYLDKYEDEQDMLVKLVIMVKNAYEADIVDLTTILCEIDPKIKKKLSEIAASK